MVAGAFAGPHGVLVVAELAQAFVNELVEGAERLVARDGPCEVVGRAGVV